MTTRRDTFRSLHDRGLFVMPNPWDIGSAKYLESLGFAALATTSSGHAATLGRVDQKVSLDEMLAHVAGIAAAIAVPLNVDAEYCFADEPAGVAETVALIAQVGAAGCSIEDFNPATGTIDSIERASDRVAAAARSARQSGMLLTARAENHLHGVTDLDDTISRLCSYRDAGAEVVYAPGLIDLSDVARVVDEVKVPFNFLLRPNGPSVPELESVGVRRVSTGGSLSRASFGALKAAALEVLNLGTANFGTIPSAELSMVFEDGPVSQG
jgi:2-methylisocitrate lyase-like PEP mutase family enzyme